MSIEKGTWVEVYQKPITHENYEGSARVVRLISKALLCKLCHRVIHGDVRKKVAS